MSIVGEDTRAPGATPTETPDPPGHVFHVAPPEELLYSLSADGKRRFMHPVLAKGRYWRIRRNIAAGLMLVFFLLPHITIGPAPAVLLDLTARRFHVFGATFHPTDNLLLAAFGFGVIVTVFFVGATFGRAWCGFACPQTVYLEFLFRPIERLIEGGPTMRRRLQKAPWTGRKIAITASKWLLWCVAALLMATTFVSYFTGWSPLVHGLLTQPSAWTTPLLVIGAVTGAILFDFGWFRDQMCTIACPYGRLQNVLADQDTLVVAYDSGRGEPRLAPKFRAGGTPAGDCVECGACFSVCPTGVDIRRGMQVECLACAQCIDACDDIMRRVGRPTHLIRFSSDRELHGSPRKLWRPRNLVYLALLTVAWSTLGVLVFTRSDAQVEIRRGGREAYRLVTDGGVANQQRIRFTNQTDQTQQFVIAIEGLPNASFVLSETPVVVPPEQIVTVNAVTTVPATIFVDGQFAVRYLVTSDHGFHKEIEFMLLGPSTPGGRP